MKKAGFTIVKIVREIENVSYTATHASETALDNYVPDVIVYNSSDESFFTKLDDLLTIMPQENTRP